MRQGFANLMYFGKSFCVLGFKRNHGYNVWHERQWQKLSSELAFESAGLQDACVR